MGVHKVDYRRQSKLFNPSDYAHKSVTVIGLGNIGSHTALALARMGIAKLRLYDFDTIEPHNLASQAYSVHEVGMLKGDAIRSELIRLNSDIVVEFIPTAYKETTEKSDIVVVAVDSMATRYALCDVLESQNVIIVDGRMGGGQCEVHTAHASAWRETLREEADDDECSARYISYTSYVIAGMVTNTVKRVLCGETVYKSTYIHTATWDVLRVKA